MQRTRKRYKFRHFATIMKDSSSDGDEQPSYTATFMERVPCNVFDVSGGEIIRGRQIAADITSVVEMRHVDGLKHEMRLNVGDRRLHIKAIYDRDGVERFHELHCQEVKG